MPFFVHVSPRRSHTQITIDRFHQSFSGKALCAALSADGQRAYLGGHSGVWRSDDGGETWSHPERPQPPVGFAVTGAIIAPAVYGLAISPRDSDVVLAATGRDSRIPAKNGIYRSSDGARSWTLVHQFPRANGAFATVGAVVFDRVSPAFALAGSQDAVAVSIDGGATWTNRTLPPPGPYWYVAIGRNATGGPVLYAAGARLLRSIDGHHVDRRPLRSCPRLTRRRPGNLRPDDVRSPGRRGGRVRFAQRRRASEGDRARNGTCDLDAGSEPA